MQSENLVLEGNKKSNCFVFSRALMSLKSTVCGCLLVVDDQGCWSLGLLGIIQTCVLEARKV